MIAGVLYASIIKQSPYFLDVLIIFRFIEF